MATLSFFSLIFLLVTCSATSNEWKEYSYFPHLSCSNCPGGSVCAGRVFKKKCVTPKLVGERCGMGPYDVCQTSLKCEKHLCTKTVQLGDACGPKGIICESKAICVGTTKSKICRKPVDVGEACDGNRYQVCQLGLKCRNGICTKPLVPAGQSCMKHGSVCEKGAICVGTRKKKKCVIPKGLGRRCGRNPFWVCKPDLRCLNGTCLGPTVPLGGSCLGRDSICANQTVCAGKPQKKICVRPRSVGKQCGRDPFWICKTGLQCLKGVCVKPKIPKGGNCKPMGSVCVDGTVCAGTWKKKICVVPKGLGGRCGHHSFWACGKGLKCLGGVCKKKLVRKGGHCEPEGTACTKGLICAEGYGRKKCVKGRRAGATCGTDPFWVCDLGLHCVNEKCGHF